MAELEAKLDYANQEITAVRTAKAETTKRLERSEGELAASKEQVTKLCSLGQAGIPFGE